MTSPVEKGRAPVAMAATARPTSAGVPQRRIGEVPAFGSSFQNIEPGFWSDTRVVDPEVNSAEFCEGCLQQAKTAGQIGHVGLQRDGSRCAKIRGLGTGASGRFKVGSIIHHDGKSKRGA